MALAFNGNLATRYFVCNVIIRLSSWRFENASSREFSNPADRSDDRCVPTTLVREISDKGPLSFHGFHISKVILLCLPFSANRRTFRKKKERERRNNKNQIDRVNDSLVVSFTPRRRTCLYDTYVWTTIFSQTLDLERFQLDGSVVIPFATVYSRPYGVKGNVKKLRENAAKRKEMARTWFVIETAILAREKVNLKHGPSRCWPLVERQGLCWRGRRGRADGGKEVPRRMKGNRKKRVFPSGRSLYWNSVGSREMVRLAEREETQPTAFDVGVCGLSWTRALLATLLMKRLIWR